MLTREHGDYYQDALTEQLAAQVESGMPTMAVFADLDDTLLLPGNNAATQAAHELTDPTAEESCLVIPVTGRRSHEGIAVMEANGLEPPVAIIGAVGTEIWIRQYGGGYATDAGYNAYLASKNFDRVAVLHTARDLIADAHPDAQVTLQYPDAEAAFLANPTHDYLPYKLGLHFFASSLGEMTEVCAPFAAAFPNFKVLACEEIQHNRLLKPGEPKKYCLDIAAATKADAVHYMVDAYGIDQGLIGGDSGNDTEMLVDGPEGFVSVLVGGYKPEALAVIESHITRRTRSPFQKIGNRRVFIETNPDRFAAESILVVARYLRAGLSERRALLSTLQ